MNQDFAEMLGALSDQQAEFLVVGAYAMAAHGTPRATGDIDIWVRPTAANAERVWAALQAFGAPLQNLSKADLQTEGIVFQIGIAPNRIDLLTRISGVQFETAWSNRMEIQLDGRIIPILGKADLITNKKATGRTKDLGDVELLGEPPQS
jgi:hypothetical protein